MSAGDRNPNGCETVRPLESARGRSDHPRVLSSDELLEGRRELWIEHEGEIYRLRATSKGRLYLTK